jgi:hypothetical protein
MATVLLIDGTDGLPVYVRWPIADEPNVYIRAEILIPSGVLSNWGSFSSTPDMVVLSEGTDPSSFVERVRFFKTGSFHWEDQWAADLTAAVTEETWHTVEVWWDSGLQTGHFAVDGETSSYGATGTSTTFEGAFVGLMNFGIDGQLWVRRIKVGTTDGGAELADYDPDTDGDPAAFGFEVVGAVSLLGSPTPTDPPLIVSATAERALVTLTYDRDLDRTSVPIPGAYAAQVNGDTRAVTRVRVGRRTVRLTLYLGAAPGDTVTVFYEPAGSDPVQGLNGDDAASLSAYPATNLTAVPAHTRADTFGQFPWRSLVCDLAGGQLSLLDGHARDRTITARLNQPWDATGYVYSASRVAQADGPDGDPVLSEGTRLLYVFRQEPDEAGSRWVCRFAGLIDNVDDIAQTEHAVTHYTARDPWQLLYNRPVTNPVNGHFPGADGITYAASPAGYVARSLIETTIATHGSVHLNMDDGTVDAGEDVTITFQQGTSVGEALDQVVATGHIDLRLDPLYDPSQPGICAVFNALAKAGEESHRAGRVRLGRRARNDGADPAHEGRHRACEQAHLLLRPGRAAGRRRQGRRLGRQVRRVLAAAVLARPEGGRAAAGAGRERPVSVQGREDALLVRAVRQHRAPVRGLDDRRHRPDLRQVEDLPRPHRAAGGDDRRPAREAAADPVLHGLDERRRRRDRVRARLRHGRGRQPLRGAASVAVRRVRAAHVRPRRALLLLRRGSVTRPIARDSICRDFTEVFDRLRKLEAEAPVVWVDEDCCLRWRCVDTADWVTATESGAVAYTP